jgi:hypothetical protein
MDGHLGNRMGKLFQGEITWTPLEPGQRFDWNRYPVSTSDLLPHLVHEHQVGGVNRMARAQYRVRELRAAGKGTLSAVAQSAVEEDARELVRYLLFAEARVAVEGRSLKDFDLKTRMFRYRCSFLVHTPQFAGLDPEVRGRVLRGLESALASGGTNPEFRYLGEDEKAVIRSILRAKVAGFMGR